MPTLPHFGGQGQGDLEDEADLVMGHSSRKQPAQRASSCMSLLKSLRQECQVKMSQACDLVLGPRPNSYRTLKVVSDERASWGFPVSGCIFVVDPLDDWHALVSVHHAIASYSGSACPALDL